ncbi:MAG: DUF3084 domain-containing protein [Candidatus Baltobacteraceae bacterium]
MGDLGRGILLVLFIVCLAGAIAYVGDRVGHQVGRKRLSLFGIRPRYTSTIVAIGTGMLIALVVTVGALVANNNVKTAFFHLNAVNSRVTQLQAQADLLEKHVRKQQVVVGVGDLMNDHPAIIPFNAPFQQRYDITDGYYKDTTAYVDRTYLPMGLRKNSTSPDEISKLMHDFVQDYRLSAMLSQGPVVLVATADQNLFANDEVHFRFDPYIDRLIFAAGQPVASIIVPASPNSNLRLELLRLRDQVSAEVEKDGMPLQLGQNVLVDVSNAQGEAMQTKLRSSPGQYVLAARAEQNIFPHLWVVPVAVSMTKR